MVGKIRKVKLDLDKIINFGLYLWIFVLPVQTRLIIQPKYWQGEFWEYGTVSLYFSEVLLALILFLWLYKICKNKDIARIFNIFWLSLTNKKFNLSKILFIIFLWLAVSIIWTNSHLITLVKISHLFLAVFGIGLIVYQRLSFNRMVIIVVAAGLLQSLFAIDQFIEQRVVANKFLGMAEQLPNIYGVSVILTGTQRWLRAYGTLPHPNILGGFLVLVVILISQQIFQTNKIFLNSKALVKKHARIFKIGLYGSLVFVISGLLLSFSRAAWLTLFIIALASGVYIIYKQKSYVLSYINILLIIVSVTFVWLSIFPTPFITRFEGREVLERQSILERNISYQDNHSFLQKYLFFGSGLGTYTKVLAESHPSRRMSLNQPVHNSWLLILSELGLVGLLLLLGLLVYLYKNSVNKFWFLLIVFSIALLMMFDHWWVSLTVGNYILTLLLFVGYKNYLSDS